MHNMKDNAVHTMMAHVSETVDLSYKDGYVRCACGWERSLGDGFNGYHIAQCPRCSGAVETRVQTTVTTGTPGNYTVKHGNFKYFVLDNGIHVQYSAAVSHTQYRKRIPR